MNELNNFIKEESRRIKAHFNYDDQEKWVYARMVKIQEEVGELSSEVLAQFNKQRGGKLKSSAREALEEELADVLITTLLLAEDMEIDVNKALRNKIEKIKKRVY